MNLYPVVILAGGLATRLRPVTEKIPKALVEVAGKPFIEHQLRLLYSRGIKDVIISAWYRAEMIQDVVGDGREFGLNVEYVFDGDVPLGTGGAVKKAIKNLSTPFFVLYGDSYLPCDYQAIQTTFDAQQNLGLMTIYYNQDKWDTSNVEMSAGKIIKYDKKERNPRMRYIDYGLGIFAPDVFKNISQDQPVDLADVYKRLVEANQLSTYEVKKRFYEAGSFDGLSELDILLTENPNRFLTKE